MSSEELGGEIAAGVEFWAMKDDGKLRGVIGIQRVDDVDLIRHADACALAASGAASAARCSST